MQTPSMPSTCFVGRILFREDGLDGLNWQQACPVPAEQTMLVDPEPPMYFCAPHYMSISGELYDAYSRAGLIDDSIVGGGPESDADGLDDLWRQSSLGEGESAAQ